MIMKKHDIIEIEPCICGGKHDVSVFVTLNNNTRKFCVICTKCELKSHCADSEKEAKMEWNNMINDIKNTFATLEYDDKWTLQN